SQQSTDDTCVIAQDVTIPDGSVLTFTKPNLRVHSALTVAPTARCSPDPPTACASDADCPPPARCLRTAQVSIQASGLLTLDASTSSGGCGGTIGIGTGAHTPLTLTAAGVLSVDGATVGGTIHLVAKDQLTLTGTLGASNTNGDESARPPCTDVTGPPPCGG